MDFPIVSLPKRFATVPDVPTAREVGYPALEQIMGWSAIYGPPGLPDDVVAKWSDALMKLNENPAWLKLTYVRNAGAADTKARARLPYVAPAQTDKV